MQRERKMLVTRPTPARDLFDRLAIGLSALCFVHCAVEVVSQSQGTRLDFGTHKACAQAMKNKGTKRETLVTTSLDTTPCVQDIRVRTTRC